VSALLVSDQEREYTVGLLRAHLLSGRLTSDEFEQRVEEAWRARFAQDLWQTLRWLPVDGPPVVPAERRGGGGSAATALVLGLLGLFLLVGSFGLAWPLALPLFVTAWALGRDARRSGTPRVAGAARAGELLGVVGTLMCLVLLAGCAAVLA
jgi:hypothetical protein